jgi:Zn-dependent protease
MDIPRIVIFIGVVAISVILHEIAHAYSAYKLGDPTGKMDGRLSFNPVNHIDPFFTILMPVIFLLMSGGSFILGGAKPVRINPLNFKNPSLGMMITSVCGPLTNMLLSIIVFFLLFALVNIVPDMVMANSYNALFLGSMIYLNIVLGIFNLVPIPPLDGSRILRFFLPAGGKAFLDRFEYIGGFLIIVIFVIFGFEYIIRPFLSIMLLVMIDTFGKQYTWDLLGNLFGR